ncbi:MAG: hypothetical protein ACXWZS_08865 [Gemmatirosa sp.]
MLQEFFRTELVALLAASRADAAFAADLLAYADGRATSRVIVLRAAPRLKVLRVLAQLLDAEPALAPTSVQIDAVSGCSDFRGSLAVHTADGVRRWRFRWDCRWRAEQAGWYTPWGLPDQARAADELNWRCFATWAPVESEGAASAVEQDA